MISGIIETLELNLSTHFFIRKRSI